MEKKRRGAPEKPPDQRKDALLTIRLSEAEKAEIDAVASGKTSAWVRDVILKAARRKRR